MSTVCENVGSSDPARVATGASAVPDYWQCFRADYAGARARFREAAQERGDSLTLLATYPHPDQFGPDGAPLGIDVARIGRSDAPRQLLAISGTHGLEGAAGSAVQVGWLSAYAHRPLPPDTSVLLIHGLNPYGFANHTRTTEHNVDLNRNFIDHQAPRPANPLYGELHDALLPRDWNETTLAAGRSATEAFRDRHGADALFDVMAKGQYDYPDGLMYGGRDREWSNLTLARIVTEHMHAAERVAFIDWHTGIGEYGQPFFLCFNDEDGPLHREAARWWGADRIVAQRPNGLARPHYQGLVFHGVKHLLGDRPMVGAVIEFGTRGRDTSLANRLDQWLRFRAPDDLDPALRDMLRTDVIDAFVPYSSVWRRAVLEHGLNITEQTIEGLSSWHPDCRQSHPSSPNS